MVLQDESNEQQPKSLTKETLLEEYNDVFDGMGQLEGEYHLEVNSEILAFVHPPRKVPVSIKEKLKEELDALVEQKIIAPVSRPTPWVSSLVVVSKPNGKSSLH